MLRTVLISIFLFLSAQNIHAQQLDTAKLDQYFDALDSANKFMGSVAISKNNSIIYQNTLGYSDTENSIKINSDTKFRIGSITKTFTATLIMKAIEEGKLTLDDTLDKYFVSIPNSEKITIHNLLQHRSGIYNFTSADDYLDWNTNFKTKEEVVSIIKKYDSVFEPGSKFEYSNSNYVLLTFILEDIYGDSYQNLLDKYIIAPLHLENTQYGDKIKATENEAYSYKWFDGNWEIESETDLSIPLGAGSIVSTPTDVLKFAHALFNHQILSETSLNQMKTTIDSFGLGLFQIPFYNKIGFGHTGGIDGFASVFSYFEEDNVAISWVSNAFNFDTNNISIALLSAVYGVDFDIPEFIDFEIDTETLDLYVGEYSSTQIPIKMTITRNGNSLIGQATGQPAFPLEAVNEYTFSYQAVDLILEFNADKKEMTLHQMGGEYLFSKNTP